MVNAKDEFLEEVDEKEVLCARVLFGKVWCEEIEGFKESRKTSMLKISYNESDFSNFLNELDFDYDNGYGTQHIFGFIWYKDGTWSERCEYDGAEWWEHKRVPEIPNSLR